MLWLVLPLAGCSVALRPGGQRLPGLARDSARSTSRRALLAGGGLAYCSAQRAAALDVDAAVVESTAGAACPVQSCVDASVAKLVSYLDVNGVPKNQKGAPRSHRAVVTVTPVVPVKFDSAAALPSYQIIMVAPHGVAADDYVQLMWIKNARTGRLLGSRALYGPDEPGSVANAAKGIGRFGTRYLPGPPTLSFRVGKGYVARGDSLVPLLYCSKHGLWEGEPFTLCDGRDACAGPGLYTLRGKVDARAKRQLEEIGAEVLRELGITVDGGPQA